MCYFSRFATLAVVFFCLLPFRAVATPAPLTLPSNLKGIQYFPRGHAWWSMLYDWYTVDGCTTTLSGGNCASGGETVSAIVQSDLATLAANGVNLIHLYLWDQDYGVDSRANYILASETNTCPVRPAPPTLTPVVTTGCTYPGFVGWDDGGPTVSPGNSNPNIYSSCTAGPNCNQWSALQAFVSMAKAKGIWLVLHFAVARVGEEMNLGAPAGPCSGSSYPANSTNLAMCLGQQYAGWVNTFISTLESYQNVLVWGLANGIPGPGSGPGLYPTFWQEAYPLILTQLQSYSYTSPSGRALAMLESGFGGIWPFCPNPSDYDVQPILSLQSWTYPGS